MLLYLLLYLNISKIAQASVEKRKNFLLSCHLKFNTNKTSSIFHPNLGIIAPITKEEFPLLFLVSMVDLKRWCSLTTIASYQADYAIFTDASARRETRSRDAAAVVTRGSPVQPEVVTTIRTKGRTFTCSYEEEPLAMESALSWTSTNTNHPSISILFCTDSRSLCQAIISSNPQTFSIHNSINSILSQIFIQLIPSYSAIPGNDLTDKAAKEATTIITDTILPVSFSSSIQVINETICNALPSHQCVALIYRHQKASLDAKQISNRKDDFLLARQSSWSISRFYLQKLLPRNTRSPSLALQISCYYDQKTKSV